MSNRQAQYSILQFVEPGGDPRNIAVLLYLPEDNRLYLQFRETWTGFSEDAVDVLRELANDFTMKAHEVGGGEFLKHMEDCLSNSLRITERMPVTIAACPADPDDAFPELDDLFRTHVST